ncbi:hypothetical protein VTK73DRAFT_3749 [Phialemonium thermophilum]|uniref:MARVEL domain-containing protein n=1 Tax=Phialemonium thermophilum TaxID=223376 RepID=A0ABR3WXZ2_9PEZI
MGARSGIALKTLQWAIRAVQFCCAAIILGIFSYFLATLSNHDLRIHQWLRAVEGISGIAVIYTAIGLLLLCCLAGHPLTSFMAIFLDICFVAAFIYIAVANRGGASSCNGFVHTPYGSGDSSTDVVDNGHGGFTALPSLHRACQLQTACLAMAIIAAFFFILSALVELALVRHRRKERRFGPGPANDYTSGYGKRGRRGFFGFGRRRNTDEADLAAGGDPNALPAHVTPDQVRNSYATEQTRVGSGVGAGTGTTGQYNKYGESGYGYGHQGNGAVPATGTGGAGYGGVADGRVSPAAPGHYPAAGGGGYGGVENGRVGATAPVQYPTASYAYEDGVYNSRV